MDVASIRDRIRRQERLDGEWFHLFALDRIVEVMRTEEEYHANGHTGLILLKAERLRVVLEVARDGVEIAPHTVHGPTLIQVLEGSLCLSCEDETRIAHAGEMVVIPHDRARTFRAEGAVAFLLALSLEG